jgi:hypothetical protein
MDAFLLPLLGLSGLIGLGWLAARAGVDSRDWPLSEEERLAQHGYTWGVEPTMSFPPLVAHAGYRLADLHREAAAERLAHAARLARAEAAVAGGPDAWRSLRARLAAALVSLAARLDRAAALDRAANQLRQLPNC